MSNQKPKTVSIYPDSHSRVLFGSSGRVTNTLFVSEPSPMRIGHVSGPIFGNSSRYSGHG